LQRRAKIFVGKFRSGEAQDGEALWQQPLLGKAQQSGH
jgi:hypothetical protein